MSIVQVTPDVDSLPEAVAASDANPEVPTVVLSDGAVGEDMAAGADQRSDRSEKEDLSTCH
jgi:hypothetical protein